MEYNDIHCDDGRHLKEKSKKEAAVAVAVACHINVCFKRAGAGGAFPPKMSFLQGDSCPPCTLDRLISVPPENVQQQKQCNFRKRGVSRCGDRSLVRICKATRLMDRWTGEARWMDETDADGAAHMQNLFKAKRTEICPHTHASFSTPEMSPAIFVFFRPPRSFTHRLAGAWLLALTLSMPIRLRET